MQMQMQGRTRKSRATMTTTFELRTPHGHPRMSERARRAVGQVSQALAAIQSSAGPGSLDPLPSPGLRGAQTERARDAEREGRRGGRRRAGLEIQDAGYRMQDAYARWAGAVRGALCPATYTTRSGRGTRVRRRQCGRSWRLARALSTVDRTGTRPAPAGGICSELRGGDSVVIGSAPATLAGRRRRLLLTDVYAGASEPV